MDSGGAAFSAGGAYALGATAGGRYLLGGGFWGGRAAARVDEPGAAGSAPAAGPGRRPLPAHPARRNPRGLEPSLRLPEAGLPAGPGADGHPRQGEPDALGLVPTGGGEVLAAVEPLTGGRASLAGLDRARCGELVRARGISAASNLPGHIRQRQGQAALAADDWWMETFVQLAGLVDDANRLAKEVGRAHPRLAWWCVEDGREVEPLFDAAGDVSPEVGGVAAQALLGDGRLASRRTLPGSQARPASIRAMKLPTA